MKTRIFRSICLFLLIISPLISNEDTKIMPKKNTVVVIETTQGPIEIELFEAQAPKTCKNFIELGKKGYYNNVKFHRIIPQFMIQGGDPTGTGMGGESIYGKKFEDEFNSELIFDKPGRLAMANAGPNTNGSQFFITTVNTPWLNMHHTIFGQVIKGMDVVKKLEAQGSQSGVPKAPQAIKKVYVKE